MTDRPINVQVLRVRPVTQQRDGLLRKDLENLGTALAKGAKHTFGVTPHVYDPQMGHTFHRAQDLRAVISSLLSKADYLVLDLCYRLLGRQAYSLVVADCLRQLRGELGDSQVRVLVLMDKFRPRSHDLMAELLSPPWSERTRLVNASGSDLPNDSAWPLDEGVIDSATLTPALYSASFERRIVRMRGVFEHPHTSGPYYSQFRYIGDAGTESLSRLLSNFVESRDIQAIVISDDASVWFFNAVAQAAIDNDVKVLTPNGMLATGVEDSDISAGLNNLAKMPSPNVLIAVPVYRIGRTLQGLSHASVGFFREPNFTYLSTIAVDSDSRKLDRDGLRSRGITVNGANEVLHYIKPVTASSFSAEPWQIGAATTLGEISRAPHGWESPARVGMWSLFARVAMGPESPFASTTRPRIGHFPKLVDLADDDARWLAYAMLRATGAVNDDVLMILPREESGSAAIARALRDDLDVAVVLTDPNRARDTQTLDPEAESLVADFSDRLIFICDESSIGGGTLNSLNASVEKVRGTPADGAIVVVAADVGPNTPTLEAIYRWRPYDLMSEGA